MISVQANSPSVKMFISRTQSDMRSVLVPDQRREVKPSLQPFCANVQPSGHFPETVSTSLRRPRGRLTRTGFHARPAFQARAAAQSSLSPQAGLPCHPRLPRPSPGSRGQAAGTSAPAGPQVKQGERLLPSDPTAGPANKST